VNEEFGAKSFHDLDVTGEVGPSLLTARRWQILGSDADDDGAPSVAFQAGMQAERLT